MQLRRQSETRAHAFTGQELVRLARAGDREAFAALWERHGARVRAVLRSTAPRHDTEDLAHEVVVSALHSIGDLRQPASFAAWLGVIARNVARRALLRRPEARHLRLAEVDDGELPAQHLDVDTLEVAEQIRRLPRCYHRPLLLRLVHDMSGREIAAQTGMTHGSVRVNLHRGMRLLRQRLGPRP